MNSQALIFDLDGTLLNTIEDIASVTNQALDKNGFPIHPIAEYSIMVGHGLKNLVKNALPGSCNETEIDKVYKAVISEYRKTPVQKTSMYPEIPNLLNELTRLQIPMAILSNKLHEITIPIVSIILGKWKFEVVLGARNNIPKKPDPYSAIEIASTMNIPPSCCLFIGDSGTDVKTALACGMNPIGVSWGYRNIEDIKSAGADIIVHRPLEILNFIHI